MRPCLLTSIEDLATRGLVGAVDCCHASLRHSYLTMLGKGGVDPRTAQELAGHSSPVLTARYSHRRLYDLAGAVEKLPDFLPTTDRKPKERQTLAATGTEGKQANPHVGPHVETSDMPGHLRTFQGDEGENEKGAPEMRKPLIFQGFNTSRHLAASSDINEDDGTRTRNHRIDSPVL